MSEELTIENDEPKRTGILTFISVLIFFGCISSILLLFFDSASKLSMGFKALIIINSIVVAAIAYGIWRNYKWGVYSYIGFSILSGCLMYFMGLWVNYSYIPSAIISIILLTQLSNMK